MSSQALLPAVAYFVLAFTAIMTALVVVTGRNLMHNALALGLMLLSVAGLYVLAGADFLGIAQVFIYVGGITVLILFGVMLTTRITDTHMRQTSEHAFLSLLLAGGLFFTLWQLLKGAGLKVTTVTSTASSAATLGRLLTGTYMLPFEVVGVILLAAVVGALAIAREDRGEG